VAGFSAEKGEEAPRVRNNNYFFDSDGYDIESVEYLTEVIKE